MNINDLVAELQKALADAQAIATAQVQPPVIPPKPTNTVQPPFGILMTLMSIFALQWDGKTKDPGDNQRGAWGADTSSPEMLGCALPITVIRDTFGGTTPDHIKGNTVEAYSHLTNKTVSNIDIVDEGPAAWTHRGIDGLWQLHKQLGHIDYGLSHYGHYSEWPAGFYVAYWINSPDGHPIEIKGWDFHKERVIGS